MFVFAPEYAEALSEPVDGESSVLRDARPGSRGVIYRAHSDQKIVAIFDVESEAYWDDEFGYMARGHFMPLAKPIARADLLSNETLEPVFKHIQGRRRLPPPAQEAMAQLIQTVGKTPLPHHSMHESPPPEQRRGRRG